MKEDPLGNFIWAKHFDGCSNTNSSFSLSSLNLDMSGNIYVFGDFADSVDFDPSPNHFFMSTPSANFPHSFFLKLNPNGNFIWAKQIGGLTGNSSEIFDVKISESNIFLVGGLWGTIDIDPSPNNIISLTSIGNNASFILKIDTAGNFNWAKQINAASTFYLALDSSSNIYTAGNFKNTVDFDPSNNVYNLTSSSVTGYAMFFEKFDSLGNFLWVRQIGNGYNDEHTLGFTVDKLGNLLATGYFNYTLDFDPGPNVYNLTASSSRSIFTLKLRNNGNFVWATKSGASVGNFEGRAITTYSMGNVYTAAIAPGGCDIDPGPAVKYVIGDCVVQKLDSVGNFVWGVGWEGDVPGWIGLDNVNSVYVTGSFSGFNKDFDPGLGSFLLNGNSQFSGFIEKLCVSPPPLNITVLKDTICIGDIAVLSVESIQGATYIWGKDGSPITNSNNDTLLVTQPGDYTVNVYGVGCPYGSDTVHVSVFPVITPTIQIASSPFSVPAGQQVTVHATVSATGGYPYTINWYNHGVLFATTTTDVVSYIKPIGKDSLSAVIKVNTPCTSPVTSNLIFVTGIDDLETQNYFFSTPNPVSNQLNIQTNLSGCLEIIDMMGRVVFQTTVINTQASIDLSSLSEGLYHYKFMTKVGTAIKDKLVIMR